ncbi:ribonuclease P protein component [Kineococcus glutinatus]|uniref:Ribonuclease P protein component n=1 Tax=Kineococcus glutinatus TaxID=1070872 RepID=A0ABP9H6W6_9ACTN
MLPAARRLNRRDDFTLVLRGGRRAGARRVVLHYAATGTTGPARVGFVVSKAVGDSVQRHRTQRQLRHLCAARLDELPTGGLLVVRALPAAAGSTSTELGADLDRGLRRLGLPVAGAHDRG